MNKSSGLSLCSNSVTLKFDKKSALEILVIKIDIKFGIKFEWQKNMKILIVEILSKFKVTEFEHELEPVT